ncbi:MAG: RusA family crossover junction endodeoxyribonuclease, partial [Thermoplasmatales archaeon]
GNHYVKNSTNRFKKIVAFEAIKVRKKIFISDVAVKIIWHCKKKGRGDLDNKLKCILDALTGVVYIDDKQVKYIEIKKMENFGYDGVTIEVIENGAPPHTKET